MNSSPVLLIQRSLFIRLLFYKNDITFRYIIIILNLYGLFWLQEYTIFFYRHTPVLYNVQNVNFYRMEIVQYRDEPLQIPQIFFFYKKKSV